MLCLYFDINLKQETENTNYYDPTEVKLIISQFEMHPLELIKNILCIVNITWEIKCNSFEKKKNKGIIIDIDAKEWQ